MILKYENNRLVNTNIYQEAVWLDDEDFIEMLIRLKVRNVSKFKVGTAAYAIEAFGSDEEQRYLIALTITDEVYFVIIEGKADYLEFLRNYVPLIESFCNLGAKDERNRS